MYLHYFNMITMSDVKILYYNSQVESVLFCPVLVKADDNGILNEEDMYFLT